MTGVLISGVHKINFLYKFLLKKKFFSINVIIVISIFVFVIIKMKYFKIILFIIVIFCLTGFFIYSVSSKTIPGDLNGVHSNLQAEGKCASCHDSEDRVNSENCLNCHEELSERIKALTGFHRDKKEDCSDCHQEHRGKNSKLIDFNIADFDHNETGYVLKGAHKKIKNCSSCHSGSNSVNKKITNSFFLQNSECKACHEDVHNLMYPVCDECHSTENWSVDIWN